MINFIENLFTEAEKLPDLAEDLFEAAEQAMDDATNWLESLFDD